MRVAIMQPYFFPYIGYWQLMNYVDKFVIYDNIEYTKKGWINRNRFLQGDRVAYMTIPLVKDSDYLEIEKRRISEEFWNRKILHQISAAYKKTPYYDDVIGLVEDIYSEKVENLFLFLQNNIRMMMGVLGINTELVVSSELSETPGVKGQERVIGLCKLCRADEYINPIGGTELYNKDKFYDEGIELKFLKSNLIPYKQYGNEFIPSLSIIDVMMFCGIDGAKKKLDEFELI